MPVNKQPIDQQIAFTNPRSPLGEHYGQFGLTSPSSTVGSPSFKNVLPAFQRIAPAPLSQRPLPSKSDDAHLPLPSQILRSQSSARPTCLACGQKNCQLNSHLHFSHRIAEMNRKHQDQLQASIYQADLTPRPSKAIPLQIAPLAQSVVVQQAEQDHLLSLWSKEWSAIRRGPEKHLFPTPLIDRILPIATKNAPLLQAVLAYSGTLWTSANHIISDLATRQQTVAVEMLSQACPSEREASTDEAMMAATLLLLVYMEQGNEFEVSKHITGLEHLVKLRGGPHYLGLSGLLAETLIHADHMQAIYFNQQPVWPLPLPTLDIGLPEKLGHGFRLALDAHELDVPLALAAKSVCKVADIFDCGSISSTAGIPRTAKNAFGYLAMMATYQLAQCNAAYHALATETECICLALILFNHVVLCDDGTITPSALRIEYQFWQALQAAEQKGALIKTSPCLYMWMIFTGLTVTIRMESQYRPGGIEKLRAMKSGAGIHTWDQLKSNVLDDYVWLASSQEETFKRMWLEVEGLRSVNEDVVMNNGTTQHATGTR